MIKLFEEFNNKQIFETEIDRINFDVSNLDFDVKEYDSVIEKTCKVYWDYYLINKKHGIDTIMPNIKKVEIVLECTIWDEEKEEEIEEEKEYVFLAEDSEFETEKANEDENEDRIPYCPREVEVDIKNRKIEIEF